MEAYVQNRACACLRCRSRCMMGPAILVTMGVLFLLDNMGYWRAGLHYTWPIILIVIGVVKVLQYNAPLDGHQNPPQPGMPPQGAITPRDPGQVNHV